MSGAPGLNRTDDLPLTRRMLCQLSYRGLAAKAGIEPATNGLTVRCTTAVLLGKKLWGIDGGDGRIRTYLTFGQRIYSPPRRTICAASPQAGINTTMMSYWIDSNLRWSGWLDLHQRPHVPETCALLPELHPGRLVEAVPWLSWGRSIQVVGALARLGGSPDAFACANSPT